MDVLNQVKSILSEVLGVDSSSFEESSALLGAVPEFDSMAVVSVITAVEDSFGIFVEDDEISAETFETVGSIVEFINAKL